MRNRAEMKISPECPFNMTTTPKRRSCLLPYIICLISIALASTQTLCDVYAIPEALMQLSGQSYSLTARITSHLLTGSGSGKQAECEIEEFYSSWQQRSRINYKLSNLEAWQKTEGVPLSGALLGGVQQVLLLDMSEGQREPLACRHLDRELAMRMFTMNALASVDHDKPDLVGPSRLLRFVGDNLNALEFIDNTVSNLDITVRLIENRIKFHYNLPGQDNSISLYYSTDPANKLAHGVPPEMHLKLGDRLMVYEFQRVKLLPNNEFIDARAWFVDQNLARHRVQPIEQETTTSVMHDLFGWNLAVGCSSVIRQHQHDDQLDLVGLEREHYRFSFSALLKMDFMTITHDMTVAYEPTIATLQMNRYNPTRMSQTTMNFLQHRIYHVMERVGSSQEDLVFDKVLVARDDTTETISCIMSRTPEPASVSHDDENSNLAPGGYKLGDMLLGSNKFTYLGRAKVRGIDAMMFESYDANLPVWLAPSSPYYKATDWSGKAKESKLFRRHPSGFLASGSEHILNTIIYLSANSNKDGKNTNNRTDADHSGKKAPKSNYQEPVSLDNRLLFMELSTFHRTSKKLVTQITMPVYDFTWHITASGINNKQFVDFFSISDKCPAKGSNQYGQIDLVLTLNKTSLTTTAAATQKQLDWLSNKTKRNLAFMRALRDFADTPTTMIYDVTSRMEQQKIDPMKSRDTSTSSDSNSISVTVSFRVSDHVRFLNELIYLGPGDMNRGYTGKFFRFRVVNFFACHMIACHQQDGTVFAYDSTRSVCFIWSGRMKSKPKLLVGSAFKMHQEGSLEVYHVSPIENNNNNNNINEDGDHDELSPLRRIEMKLKSAGSLSFLPILDDGHEDTDLRAPTWIQASIQSYRISHQTKGRPPVRKRPTSQRDEIGATKADLILSSSDNELLGFGLVAPTTTTTASNQMNWLVVPDEISPNEMAQRQSSRPNGQEQLSFLVSEMTFGQCQAACLSSPKCRAFSYCIRAGQIECVLTEANFRSSTLTKQLNNLDTSKLKFGETIKLEVTPASKIELVWYPNCELHDKSYMDLFDRRRDRSMILEQQDNLSKWRPVADREECAQVCFETTVGSLKLESGENQPESPRLTGKPPSTTTTFNVGQSDLHQLHKWRMETHPSTCIGFLYIEPADNNGASLFAKLQEDHQANRVEIGTSNKEMNGYCRLNRLVDNSKPPTRATDEKDSLGNKKEEESKEVVKLDDVLTELYEIDYSFMFDKQHGILLNESPTSPTEQQAFLAMKSQDGPSERDIEVIEAFVERGDNIVIPGYAPYPSVCAKYCFTQILSSWPICKSFGVVRESFTNYGSQTYSCLLYSVTLRETLLRERYDLVKDQGFDGTRNNTNSIRANSSADNHEIVYWHYEPKPNFVGPIKDLTARLQMSRDYWRDQLPSSNRKQSSVHLHAIWLLACSLAILVLGTYMGVQTGKKFLMRLDTIPEDREDLVESVNGFNVSGGGRARGRSVVGIEFRNLATCYEEPELEAANDDGLRAHSPPASRGEDK